MRPKRKRKAKPDLKKNGRKGESNMEEDVQCNLKKQCELNKIQIGMTSQQTNVTVPCTELNELGTRISKVASRCSKIQEKLIQKRKSPKIRKEADWSPLCTPKKIFKSLMRNGSDDEGELSFTPVRPTLESFQIFTSGIKFLCPEFLEPLFTEDMIAPNKFGSKMYLLLTPENFRFALTQEMFCFNLLDENERAAIACSCIFLVSSAKDELLIRKAYRNVLESGYCKFQSAHFETILRNWGVPCTWQKDLIETQYQTICERENSKENHFYIKKEDISETKSSFIYPVNQKLGMENLIKIGNSPRIMISERGNEHVEKNSEKQKSPRKIKGKAMPSPHKTKERKDFIEQKCISPSLLNVELALDCVARSLPCFSLQELRMTHFNIISLSMDPTLCRQSHVTLHFLVECQHQLLSAGVEVSDLASDFTHFDFPNSVMAILFVAPKTTSGVKIASLAAAMVLSRALEYPFDNTSVTFSYFGEMFKSSGEKIFDMPSSLAYKCFLLLDFILSTLDPDNEDANARQEAVKKIQEVLQCKMRYSSTQMSDLHFSSLSMLLECYIKKVHYPDEK